MSTKVKQTFESKLRRDLAIRNKLVETFLQGISEGGISVELIRHVSEENFEMLEENQVNVTAMFSSRYLSTFEEKCVYW